MFKKMKAFVQSATSKVAAKVAMIAGGLMTVAAGRTFAAATVDTETVTAMTTAFGDLKATALAALAAIAGIAIVLFAAIYAWRYGKQVFKIISK